MCCIFYFLSPPTTNVSQKGGLYHIPSFFKHVERKSISWQTKSLLESFTKNEFQAKQTINYNKHNNKDYKNIIEAIKERGP